MNKLKISTCSKTRNQMSTFRVARCFSGLISISSSHTRTPTHCFLLGWVSIMTNCLSINCNFRSQGWDTWRFTMIVICDRSKPDEAVKIQRDDCLTWHSNAATLPSMLIRNLYCVRKLIVFEAVEELWRWWFKIEEGRKWCEGDFDPMQHRVQVEDRARLFPMPLSNRKGGKCSSFDARADGLKTTACY